MNGCVVRASLVECVAGLCVECRGTSVTVKMVRQTHLPQDGKRKPILLLTGDTSCSEGDQCGIFVAAVSLSVPFDVGPGRAFTPCGPTAVCN